MKGETLLSEIEIKKLFSNDVVPELISTEKGFYLAPEYIIIARNIELKNKEFKDVLYQDVKRYLPISEKEFSLRKKETLKISYGLVLEKLTFTKKRIYVLRDILLHRVYFVNDKKGSIEKIVNIGLSKIVQSLQRNPRIKVKSIVINNIAEYIFYFDPVEKLLPKKEYKIRVGDATFVLPVIFSFDQPIVSTKDYYNNAVVKAEDFNRFIRVLLYHLYKSKD